MLASRIERPPRTSVASIAARSERVAPPTTRIASAVSPPTLSESAAPVSVDRRRAPRAGDVQVEAEPSGERRRELREHADVGERHPRRRADAPRTGAFAGMFAEPASRALPAPSSSVSTVRPTGVLRTRIGSSSPQRDCADARCRACRAARRCCRRRALYSPLGAQRRAVPRAAPSPQKSARPLSSSRAASVAASMRMPPAVTVSARSDTEPVALPSHAAARRSCRARRARAARAPAGRAPRACRSRRASRASRGRTSRERSVPSERVERRRAVAAPSRARRRDSAAVRRASPPSSSRRASRPPPDA